MTDPRTELIVGRTDEVQLVRSLIDRDEPGVLVLLGEAGIGKTTLLDVACSRAERAGMVVLRAQAEDHYGARPMALLAAALADLDDPSTGRGDELVAAAHRWRHHGDGDPAAPATPAVSDAVAALTDRALDLLEHAARTRPVLLALDDLQWADPASLLVLSPLLRRATHLGVRFALAARPVPRPAALQQLLDRLPADGRTVRAVAPLTDTDVTRLAALCHQGPVGDRLLARVRKAGGNPFLVRELLAAPGDDDEVPEALTEMIARRLRAAGDRVTESLRVAAVLGGSLRPDDLAAVTGRPLVELSQSLTEATQAGLLVDEDGTLSFRHDLVREALLHETPPAVRRALHRQAARVLDERGAAPEVVAAHLVAGAERGDRAVITALRDVARGGAPVVVADLLLTALDHCEANDPERPALAAEAADALVFAGRPGEAVPVIDAALAAGPSDAVAYALRACRSHALFLLGDPAAAVSTWIDDGGRGFATEQHHLERAEVALARLFSGDPFGARTDATAALDDEAAATPLARATAHAVLAWLDASAVDMPSALAHAEASVAEGLPDGRRGATPYGPHLVRAAVADAAGLDDVVADALAAARRQISDHGMGTFEPLVYAVQAIHELRTGRWDDALASTDAGAAAMTDTGIRLAANWLAAVRALIQLDRDDPDGAERTLETATEVGVPLGQDWVALARARLLDAQGRTEEAVEHLGAVVELLVAVGVRSCLAYAGPELARLVGATGDAARADRLRTAMASLPAAPTPPMAGSLAAMAAALDGDAPAAARAAAALEACGRRAEAARTFAWAAARLADTEPDAARQAARQATTLFDAMGAGHPTGVLRAQLRETGVRFRVATRPTTTTGWEALTPTEQRVVALVAQGLTNAAIAEQLVVSRRTVESHLVRVYRKLSVGSRVELAQLARAAGAVDTSTAAQPPA